ncbi:sugar phosphate isomerase/epimerase family protein [Cohnella massiliensis]|uniref:sugar phosphate isomerase/epimerase family protein n=1 Tax=Cohnella massiliensis TaxID=1816691 RepID=UPI0009BA3C61|nr:sugar phosphate isomerase/epimerase [Cohnella massiliensis]
MTDRSIGVLAHLFGCLPYRELAAKVGQYGFKHVQLALWKAIQDYDFSRPGRLSPGLAQTIGEAFERNGVRISVLGCYLHMFERDEEQRRLNVTRFKELLRHARDFGCPTVAFETGVNPGEEYADRDWTAMRETLAELAEEAERWGVYVGLEAANRHLVATAGQLSRMLGEVPSRNIGVVLDPGNLLNAANFDRQDEVIAEAFRLLGDRIIACHAKDRRLEPNGKLIEAPPGHGQMNYKLYMELLEASKPGVDIVMEHAAPDQMEDCKRFLESF